MISLFFILNQVLYGYQLKIITSVFGIELNKKEWLGLVSVQSMGNYLPLSGGVFANVAYLKIKKNLSISDYFGYLTGDTILKIAIFGLTGFVLQLIFWLAYKEFNLIIMLIALLFLLAGLFYIFLPNINYRSRFKIINWLIGIHDGWLKIKQNKKVLVENIFIHLIGLVFISLQYYFVFKELHYQIDIISIISLTIMTNIIRIASIFPGNLGLRESVSGFVLKIFGYSFGDGVVISLIARIISMFWIFLFGIIFTFIFIGKGKLTSNEINETSVV